MGTKRNFFGKKDKNEQDMSEQTNQKETTAENTAENLAENEVKEPADIAEEAALPEAEKEIPLEEKLQLQLQETQDKYIRLMAEFDNFRKRSLKERSELIKTAGEDILVGILPVLDDFERGLVAMENVTEVEPVKQGVQLIHNKFKEFLMQRGIKEIESAQQAFNCDIHEALTKIPAPTEDMKGKVVDVIQKGYYLNEKVVRFAKVVVGE